MTESISLQQRVLDLMKRDPAEAQNVILIEISGLKSDEAFGLLEEFLHSIIPAPGSYAEWVKETWFRIADGGQT